MGQLGREEVVSKKRPVPFDLLERYREFEREFDTSSYFIQFVAPRVPMRPLVQVADTVDPRVEVTVDPEANGDVDAHLIAKFARQLQWKKGTLPIPKIYIQVHGKQVDPPRASFTVGFLVPAKDRDTGEDMRVQFCERYRYVGDPKLVFAAVRNALHRALTHEVDELLLVAGERTWDPHRGEKS